MANERAFKAKLRKLILPHAYIQSMSSYATNGTPDLWISNKNGDMWMEVKYVPNAPRMVKPKLTALQAKWLNDRHDEGRLVCVVVGVSMQEAILYVNKEWNEAGYVRQPIEDIIAKLI